ncbi:hypothetical protein FG167_00655 [Lacinutrix sp. WUR7]|uniref:DUF6056 family protein n=1 Tax=Lacinutrix sp. WUR7 TaxID=2653681 RepID=UPI00193C9198|nr:DUF6056 family protein [Lacinutrix sp. WUR7]QRM87788.1 hypothetical protein FG167_00655 [Lacinutrix sp. WUR7]
MFQKINNQPFNFHKLMDLTNNYKTIYFIGFLILLPLILISFYNNPSGDDFDYTLATKGGVDYLTAQKSIYINWSGRYVATALLTITEFVRYPFTVYKIIPMLVIVSLIISISFAVRCCLPSLKRTDNHKITIYIFIIYLIMMPSVVQAFYWLPASMSYQISNILTLFFIGFLNRLLKTKATKHLIACMLLAILIIGTNETAMLLLNYLLFCICIYWLYTKKRAPKPIIILLFCCIICSLVVLLAPGNAIRSANIAVKHEVIDSIKRTILTTFNYSIIWLPVVILLVGLLYNTICQHVSKNVSAIFKSNPYFLFTAVLFIPFIGFFPSYWALSHVAPGRTINMIAFYFLIGCLFFAISIMHQQLLKNTHITKKLQFGLFVVFFCTIASNTNIRTAFSNVLSGDASAYNTELQERYTYLLQTEEENCIVSKLNHKPATIYFDDISSNKEDWRNKSYQNFFEKTSIIITTD